MNKHGFKVKYSILVTLGKNEVTFQNINSRTIHHPSLKASVSICIEFLARSRKATSHQLVGIHVRATLSHLCNLNYCCR